MKWEPHTYQIEALKFMYQRRHAGLFLDPGMGKTSSTLALVSYLRERSEVDRVLIVAPIRPVYKVWPSEIKKWDDFKHLSYTILHGPEKDKNLNKVSDIYLINPEGLKWFFENKGLDKIRADMLVIDESTKFKDYSTSRFKLIKPHLSRFKRRIILTGEPAPNGYLDLFGQCYLMDVGAALGKFVSHYRAQYFYSTGFGGYQWKLRIGADKEIQEKLRPSVMRLSAEKHLDMPELIFDDILVDIPEEARKIYKEFETQFLAQVGDTTILSVNAAAVGSKCRQVANGGVYDEHHISHHIHDVKTVALTDLVEQLQGNPVLVVYEFQHDLDRIKKAFPEAPCITGLVGNKLDRVINDFNAGNTPVLLAHPASGGHGLNLQEACHHVAFYGLGWDYDHYSQIIRRVYRQGNKSDRVIVHRILADRTLDKIVAKVLLNKENVQEEFLKAIQEEYL
jgi:SNF2 family DNA or RNA helicase